MPDRNSRVVLVVRSVGRLVSQFAGLSFGQLFCPSVRRLVGRCLVFRFFGSSARPSVCARGGFLVEWTKTLAMFKRKLRKSVTP